MKKSNMLEGMLALLLCALVMYGVFMLGRETVSSRIDDLSTFKIIETELKLNKNLYILNDYETKCQYIVYDKTIIQRTNSDGKQICN